jgi:putative DNA primase/helicase
MIDEHDPFAPIDESETAAEPEVSKSQVNELVVVTPVPADAQSIGDAAKKLFGRPPDHFGCYHNKDCKLLFAVARWNGPGGKKSVRPLCWVRYPDGREAWAFKNHPAPRPLYRLNLLAGSPDAPVVIVEGEKCAEAAQDVFPNSVVTTSPGGAGAADKADWKYLAQRPEVLIWPDADEPGGAYGEKVALILHRLGVPKIRIVDAIALAGCTPDGSTREPEPGWDVAQALDEGWTLDSLRNAVEKPREV